MKSLNKIYVYKICADKICLGKNLIIFSIFGFILFFATSCQQKPTVLSDTGELLVKKSSYSDVLLKNFSRDKKIVLLDAREKFDFEAFHLPGSISFPIDEILERDDRGQRRVTQDLFKVARRLANYGLNPQTQVLVLGKGAEGFGEEAAVAHILRELGVRNVLATSIENFRANPLQSSLPVSETLWKPSKEKLIYSIHDLKLLSQKKLLNLIPNKAKSQALQSMKPLKPLRGVIFADSLSEPSWTKNFSDWRWSVQVFELKKFVDDFGSYTAEGVTPKLNLNTVDWVVIQSSNITKAFALAHIAHLAGAVEVYILEP